MPLSIFIDALPYTYIKNNLSIFHSKNVRAALLKPDLGYSSNLHWALYCGKTPDDIGAFTDWIMSPEKSRTVCLTAKLASPFDVVPMLGILARKALNKLVFRRNAFANIPFFARPYFSEAASYLFWNSERCGAERPFNNYELVLQDENKLIFEEACKLLQEKVNGDYSNIFAAFGFADEIGHKFRRGTEYDRIVTEHMRKLGVIIEKYSKKHPDEEIIIASDHGMSTIKNSIDIDLQEHFGKEGIKNYIAYKDSTVLRVYSDNEDLLKRIKQFLAPQTQGHLVTEDERNHYGVTDRRFGNIIYILREGSVFLDNWFGVALRKKNRKSETGSGMHGFVPEIFENDHDACVVLLNSDRPLSDQYDYRSANKLLISVMEKTGK